MVLLIFCVACFITGSLLHIVFRRFSWIYLLVSVVISVAGLLATRWALGEIGPPFPHMLELVEELIGWNLGPWLILAFLPLQLGYLAALGLRLCFCSPSSSDGPH